MIRTGALRGETYPEEVNVPGTPDPAAVAAAEEKARRQRIMMIGGVSILGVVVAGALALVYLTKEPRTHVDRHGLQPGQKRCFGHVRYKIMKYGPPKKIGYC